MENEKTLINTNETSLEQRNYSKEFWYLNQLKWKLDFDFYKNPILSESNFYSSIARYIYTLQKEGWNREGEIQKFINSIINFNGSNPEKLLYIDKFLGEKQLKWSEEKGMNLDVELLESIITKLEKRYERWSRIIDSMIWVKPSMIPQRFYWRFTQSWLESKVIEENRKNFVNAMRQWMKKAEELKKEL